MTPPGYHIPWPGFNHLSSFVLQRDVAALHRLASHLFILRGPLTIVEVGSFAGLTANVLAQYADSLWCVDTWTGSGESYTPFERQSAVGMAYANDRDVFRAFLENTAHLPSVFPLRMPSLEAAAHLVGPLDMVFIDAGHSYPEIKADIEAWWPNVGTNGLIVGHDYESVHFPGVVRAVDELGMDGLVSTVWWKEKT